MRYRAIKFRLDFDAERVSVYLRAPEILHPPHTDKGAVASVRRWLEARRRVGNAGDRIIALELAALALGITVDRLRNG
ncbi:MAG: hypothetical protein KF868_14125, partial [Acidobacteria bacterium]|nr:hypothetical protein [Acidobacteriota bacterium]